LILMSEVYADGGIQRFNRTFLTACARLDVACEVLALNDSDKSRTRWPTPALLDIKVFDHDKISFSLAAFSALTLRRYDFIVVGHVNLLGLAVLALAVRRQRAMHKLLIAHGIEVWSCIRGRRRSAIRRMDTLLCVSRYTAQMMQRQAPELGDERFSIFPNALSESWAEHARAGARSGGRRILPERFLLSVTRIDRSDRYKGIVTALEAFAMVADRSLHYVIAGSGDDREFLERVARRLLLDGRVHFIGSVSDSELADLYRSCTAFVLPSGKEGFGIVFLEAMYFGAPVIAAAAKGAVDVVQHDSTGLLVPYGDASALKDAIERLLTDSELRDRVRSTGSQTVSAEGTFTFHAYVRRLAKVLGVPAPAAADAVPESAAVGEPVTPLSGTGT
jgi:phosphatidylinositol alpha-1,6-mannosyltransferase